MKVSAHKWTVRLVIFSLIGCLVCLGAVAQAQGRYGRARDLVSRVQEDLRRAAHFTRGKQKEQERYENAQRHLSQFDRALSKGKFDKEKLDAAIDDLNNVVEHNTLESSDRDALTQDLRDLRELRKTHG